MPSSIEPIGVGEVLGREGELAALSRFIAGVADGPVGCLLEGEPGIGKTTLWRAAVGVAREREYHVLECRPAGSEVQLSFAGLGDLLDELLGEALIELPVPQRRALEVALLLAESRGPPPDRRAIGLAALGILRVLAHARPVLVAVDDAQWLDGPTAAVLEFALRRLGREQVGLLASVRVEAGQPSPLDLGRVFPEERRLRLRVGPLSVGVLHHLVRARIGIGLARPLLLRVHQACDGNPFYALELARALESAGGRLEPTARLPVPERLQELVWARLEPLPRPVYELLLAVASLSDPTISTVQAVTSAGRARSRLQMAAAAGVLELEGDRIRFTHPLLSAAVYSEAGPERRRRMHRRLAAVVDDQEAQARHLALGMPGRDAELAAALDRAAHQAAARGAPEAAAELLELAIERTPVGHDSDLRRRKLDAADAQFRSGAIDRADEILRTLVAELPAGDERADVLLRLARVAVDLDAALELGEQAEREASGDDAVRCRIHILLGQGWTERGISHALEHGRMALMHAERSGQRQLILVALARLSLWELWAGRSPSGLLEQALALEEPIDESRGYEDPRMPLSLWRMYQGRLDDARAGFEAQLVEAEALGDQITCLAARGRLVDVEVRTGNWPRAEAHATSVYELAEQIGLAIDGGLSLYWRALVDAHFGRVAEARSAAELGAALASDARARNVEVMNLGVLGFLELSLGNDAAAEPYLTPLLAWLAEKGMALAPHPLTPYALEALVAVGELKEARKLSSRFEVEARALDSPWGLAIGARCSGLLAAAEGDLASALAALELALTHDEIKRWPFEYARTMLVFGRIQRRAKRKAAAKLSLEAALAIFEQLRAPLWSQRSRDELERIGLRRAAANQLTENERRVAALAASGLTNREVAARLFMSPKTVEANLARAYRKFGIHSRAELGARLANIGRDSAQT